jgi:hypothetical protein
MSNKKRKKTDRHRQPRGPAALHKPTGTSRLPEGEVCLPRQQSPFPLVRRSGPRLIRGRLYMATARLRVDGDMFEFDLLASLYAVATGELTGVCADLMAAYAFTYIQKSPIPLPECNLTTSPTALVDSIRRLIDEGFIGRDKHGGYLCPGAPARKLPTAV